MRENIFARLDLGEYLFRLESNLSREKPLFLQGDSKINYEKINELAKFDLQPCQKIANLDDALMRVNKQGILHISEIYEFVKIINYFLYLKSRPFTGSLSSWLVKIEIPTTIAEIAQSFDNKGELKDEVDERFKSLKEAHNRKKGEIATELRKLIYAKSLNLYLVDTQIHYINDTECLLVRGGFNHGLKGSVVARSAGGYFYVLPDTISKLKSEQGALLDKIAEVVYEHCKKISLIFTKHYLFLKFINSAFDQIDSLIARANLMRSDDLELVLADGSHDIIISGFSHPALKNAKSVDVEFKGSVLLITGVNAGGKSMLLKSIMCASIMAKYLLPMKIDSNRSKIGTFKEFDAIIEDPQNVKNDISTFAGRMLHFSKLFGVKNLLLGIDEIELGTDFEEAASLYGVLINQLKNSAKIIITTHHKRLAMLLAKSADVELVAALYDEELQMPKYEFLKGTIGKSYAFETAIRYNIPQNLVAMAKKEYGEDKENLNVAIAKTLNLELELRQKLDDVIKKERNLEQILQNAKDERARFSDEIKEIRNRLENEYYRAINEAKKTLKYSDIKEKQRGINRANELLKVVFKPQIKDEVVNFEIGDGVKYGNIKGQIISINKNDAIILSEGMKLRVPLNLLKRSGNTTKAEPKTTVCITKPTSASVVLDLHGLRADEALSRLDKFISDSLITGFDEVLIKHGIGAGKLSVVVKEFLKNHPKIKEFHDALPNEGGFGSKIVKL